MHLFRRISDDWRAGFCRCLLAGSFALLSASAFAAPVEVVGLFNGQAVLRVPGAGEVLYRVGQAKHGVTLVAANAASATVRYQGQEHRLTLSARIAGAFRPVERQQVVISADRLGQYYIRGAINGEYVNFLVDTGASVVAISSRTADRLGIDYRSGERGNVQTAQGLAEAFFLDLDEVTVGGLTARGVGAAVIRGAFPVDILLGMSFLRNVRMEEEAGVLTLSR